MGIRFYGRPSTICRPISLWTSIGPINQQSSARTRPLAWLHVDCKQRSGGGGGRLTVQREGEIEMVDEGKTKWVKRERARGKKREPFFPLQQEPVLIAAISQCLSSVWEHRDREDGGEHKTDYRKYQHEPGHKHRSHVTVYWWQMLKQRRWGGLQHIRYVSKLCMIYTL